MNICIVSNCYKVVEVKGLYGYIGGEIIKE